VRGLFQGQEQNADVFVQKIDGVARIFPELLLEDLGFVVPGESFVLGVVERSSHQLDLIIHFCPQHENRFVLAASVRLLFEDRFRTR